MAAKHDRIVALLRKKMCIDGFKIIAYEGEKEIFPETKLSLPIGIIRHRPDIIGIKKNTVAVGEAKTESDINSKRTKEQILDFYNAKARSGQHLILYLATTDKGKEKLLALLGKYSIIVNERVKLLIVPELLLK